MTRRALLLAALVVLAGCAGPLADEETAGPPTPTRTEGELAGTGTENDDGTDRSPAATGTATTMPATPTAEPTPTATLTPPEESPAATFLVDGEPSATVSLEVADDPSERSRGLMHRESLPEDHGMLFVFASERPLSFWMKNTLIPLDMIFVAANGTVLNVEHASVQPNASDEDLRRYPSDGPAKYVIEVNRGFANRTGVGAGSRVVFHGNETLLTPEG